MGRNPQREAQPQANGAGCDGVFDRALASHERRRRTTSRFIVDVAQARYDARASPSQQGSDFTGVEKRFPEIVTDTAPIASYGDRAGISYRQRRQRLG